MHFDEFELKQAETRVDKKSWDKWLQTVMDKGCFLLNCSGAKFADMIIVCKGGKYVIFIQEKHGEGAKNRANNERKIPTLSYKKVKAEHDKCKVKTPHLFVIITDEVFDSKEKLENNEIVLPSNMHSAAIGPLLALLRKHNHVPQELQKMRLEEKIVGV